MITIFSPHTHLPIKGVGEYGLVIKGRTDVSCFRSLPPSPPNKLLLLMLTKKYVTNSLQFFAILCINLNLCYQKRINGRICTNVRLNC